VRGVQAKYGGAAVGGAAVRSVCPAGGCGTRGDRGSGVGVGAEPWDRRSPRGIGVRARSAWFKFKVALDDTSGRGCPGLSSR
jgi:hypothetical protein